MGINWTNLLNDHFIDYVTSGPKTTKGHIEIKCPFCGDADESMHLGIHLASGRYYCWRDQEHRGKRPEYLVSRLLGVSQAQAALIVKGYTGLGADDFDALQGFTGAYDGALNQGQLTPIAPVSWPSEFRSLTDPYLNYLKDRHFDKPQKVADYYNLTCCQIGRWKQRLIIPVLTFDRDIIGWQGRAIVKPKIAPRYLTSHPQVKRTCFNLQNINQGGDVLFICEGPFDALKLDWYGKPNFRATCTFGATPTLEQISELSSLSAKFNKMMILFDQDSAGVSGGFSLYDWLPRVQFGQSIGNDDPGAMTEKQVKKYIYGKNSHSISVYKNPSYQNAR